MLLFPLFIQTLLAAASFAHPNVSQRDDFNEPNELLTKRQSFPVQPGPGQSIGHTDNTVTTLLWAGAGYSLTTTPGTLSWKSASMVFEVPTPKPPINSLGPSESYSASAAVSMDGLNCPSVWFQAGVVFNTNVSGVSYNAWYQWQEYVIVPECDISFSAGHTVTISLTAATTTSGTVVIKNGATGKTYTKELDSQPALCGQEVHWTVQAFHSTDGNVSPIPLCDFGTLTLTSPSAKHANGTDFCPEGSQTLDIQQNGKVLTSTTVSTDTVNVSYL